MSIIKPFSAYRPTPELASKIAALPYDVYNREEAKEVVKDNPYSFLNIDRPETQFASDFDMYSVEAYEKAKELLNSFIDKNYFIKDNSDCYYIYELTMEGRKQTGLVACAAIDDYLNNVIKKHENTRADKELDRINHVSYCGAQTGPIFLAYRKNETVSSIINEVKNESPVYAFTSEDNITHKVWIISKSEDILTIQETFSKINEIYIADGHHRCASAVKVGLNKRKENPDYTGAEDFNYFLSVLFADEELMIMDYNRVVKTMNNMSSKEFLNKLSSIFTIEEISKQEKPKKKGEITMYFEGKWYLLTFFDKYLVSDPVLGLDVSLLQDNVLSPMFGIQDPKTDKNIDFVGGIRGLSELEKRVNTDCKVAFCMYPTSIQELFKVADNNLLMPPKSTWFEPKLRSGLFIHKI